MDNAPPTVLIIDNDEGMVRAITIRLEHLGYRCVAANTGRQGLDAFAGTHIDLVITDLNMPVMDGLELTRSIRETSEVPVIIVTGFRDAYRRELRQISNVTIVEKPFEPVDLLELVEAELITSGCELPAS